MMHTLWRKLSSWISGQIHFQEREFDACFTHAKQPKGHKNPSYAKTSHQTCSNPILLNLLCHGLNPSLDETILFWILNECLWMSKSFKIYWNPRSNSNEAKSTSSPVHVAIWTRIILMGTMFQWLGHFVSFLTSMRHEVDILSYHVVKNESQNHPREAMDVYSIWSHVLKDLSRHFCCFFIFFCI